MKRKILESVIVSVLLVAATAALALLFTDTDSEWYAALIKPSFQPPSEVFAIVWTAVYLLYAASLSLAQINGADNITYILYGLIGLMNILWCLIFFTLQMPATALIIIIAYILFIVFAILRVSKISSPAAGLLVPSLIWLIYATALNIGIILLN